MVPPKPNPPSTNTITTITSAKKPAAAAARIRTGPMPALKKMKAGHSGQPDHTYTSRESSFAPEYADPMNMNGHEHDCGKPVRTDGGNRLARTLLEETELEPGYPHSGPARMPVPEVSAALRAQLDAKLDKIIRRMEVRLKKLEREQEPVPVVSAAVAKPRPKPKKKRR